MGERAVAMAERTNALEVRVTALNTVGTAFKSDPERGARLLRQSLELALRHELVGLAQRAYNNLATNRVMAGQPLSEVRAVMHEAAFHGRRYGFRSAPMVIWEGWFALEDGEWEKLPGLVEELRQTGWTVWADALQLRGPISVALLREGPTRALPLIDGPRRRLLAGDAQSRGDSLISVLLLLIAGEPRQALEHAELAATFLESDYWHPYVQIATVAAIMAARAIADAELLKRWVALGLRETETRTRLAASRRAYVAAENAVLAGDRDTALRDMALAVELVLWGFPIGTLLRLRRAELLQESGKPDEAGAELREIVPFWRKVKATWYLGELRKWADARGLPFPDEVESSDPSDIQVTHAAK